MGEHKNIGGKMKRSVFFAVFMLFSCTQLPEAGKRIVVINNVSNTISLYSLTDSVYHVNTVATGTTPNDIKQRGDSIFVVNSGFGGTPSFEIFSVGDDIKSLLRYPLPQGSNPYAFVLVDNKAYITASKSGNVYVLDIVSGKIEDSIKVGLWPEGIVSKEASIYVACSGLDSSFNYNDGYVYIINRDKVVDSIKVGMNPQDMIVDRAHRLHVLCTGNYNDIMGEIYVLEKEEVVDSLDLGISASVIALDRDERVLIADFATGTLLYNSIDLTWIKDKNSPLNVKPVGGFAFDSSNEIYITVPDAKEENYLKIFDADLNLIIEKDLGPGLYAQKLVVIE